MQKTVVYGLPMNPMPLLEQLKGASFCVSYATRKKLGKQLEQAIALVGDYRNQILLVDNGAFSAWQNGVNTMNDESYLNGFAAWANDIADRCPQAIIVLPDVIDGTWEQNRELAIKSMGLVYCDRAMPIWHMHEPIEYLLWMAKAFTYVGIGSSAQYAKVGTDHWHARVREAMDALATLENRPRVHMMRGTNELHNYEFDSADSVNVARNHNRWKRSNPGENHVARMAARINAKVQATAGEPAAHQVANPLVSIVALDGVDRLAELGFEVGAVDEAGNVRPLADLSAEEICRLWDAEDDDIDPNFIGPIQVICIDDIPFELEAA